MQDEPAGRSLTDLLFRRRRTDAEGQSGRESESLPTKGLGKFLGAVSGREAPVVLDLGPVVGSNVSFLGERLGCKFFVEDVFADVERLAREGRAGELAGFLETRFTQPAASVDGILCWDLVDYLDKGSAQVLARHLVRVLRPGGALLAFFTTIPPKRSTDSHYTKYVIADDTTLQHRPYAGSRARDLVLNNRDIDRLFDGLKVTESFLLLTRTREILFRKPTAA